VPHRIGWPSRSVCTCGHRAISFNSCRDRHCPSAHGTRQSVARRA
jgi:hypothetical protein